MRENPEVRRAIRTGRILLGLLVLFIVALSAMKPYAEYLWYSHDVRLPQVFSRGYSARGLLLVLAFFPTWALLHFSLRRALSITLVYLRRPDSAPLALLSQMLGWLQDKGREVVRWASPIVALFLALGLANEWNTWLLALNGGRFGHKDPAYGLDLGFYVFQLPWYRALANYAFVTSLIVTGLSVAVFAGLQSLAALAKIEMGYPRMRAHILTLVALTLFAAAAQVWLKTYEIGLIDSTMFTGAGYAGAFKVGAERILAVLLFLLAVISLINIRAGQAYTFAVVGGIVLGAYYLLVVQAVPLGMERIYVATNFAEVEAPFAKRAIEMTRYAYGLDKIETRDFDVKDAPSRDQISASQATLENMRLWDPEVMKRSFVSMQSLRNYYTFDDVDIDRYTIGGKPTMVMLSPREVDPDSFESWNLRRLLYTHGYGAVVAKVNAASTDGRPVYLSRDIPVQTIPELRIDAPQVYFGDRRNAIGMPLDEHVLVGADTPEVDYQVGTRTETTQWKGERGVPVSGFLSRLAHSFALVDAKLIVPTNLTSKTRLLRYRNVVERASKALPFLQFDNDPYLVIHEGRLIWMLDGYTITDMVPYSAMVRGGAKKLNYIRNPIKATVDAYTGEVNAYAVEPDEPMLKAYMRIYPGLVRPVSELPQGLREHFRYPEDMLSLQCWQIAKYHVTDARVFLSNGDAWQVAVQRGETGAKEPVRPYYVIMRLPDEKKAGFLQIVPFTPLQRPNLSGWIAAHCDPDDYGRLTMYRFRGGSPPPGPELMETNFTSDPEVSYVNRTYNNEQSEIILGNLLVVPIGDSVMYVEPLFLQSKAQGLQNSPPLFRVVLALKDRIVVKPTYREALEALFGAPEPEPSRPTAETPRQSATAREALRLIQQAEAAMRAGDWAKYGEMQKQLKRVLEQIVKDEAQP